MTEMNSSIPAQDSTRKHTQKNKRKALIAGLFLLILVIILLSVGFILYNPMVDENDFIGKFNGENALRDVQFQVSLGARIPGSEAHQQAVDWMVAELSNAGWETDIQTAEMMGHPIKNVVGRFGQGRPWLVLGAHYDSRLVADDDRDPNKRSLPVPGANDGASGVAVLLEIARAYPKFVDSTSGEGRYKQIWLVFFDAEDNGDIPGWFWILGSTAFVEALDEHPDAAVILDMIGDADLQIYRNLDSDRALTDQIWAKADELGYSSKFIPEQGYSILDDHIPFLRALIPAVNIGDFNYPFWHTTEDTVDKVSARSLYIVGETILEWLLDG